MQGHSTRRAFLKQSTSTWAAVWSAAGGLTAASASRGTLAADSAFQPRFAICNETFGKMPFAKAFALAAECGYQGIEVAPFTVSNDVTDISAGRRTEIRREAEKAGLAVTGLHWLLARTKGLHLTSPDADVRKKTAGYLGALADFCADLGGKLLVFGSPKQRNLLPGVTRAKGMQYAEDVIRQALPALEKRNVMLALEPLSPKTTNFLRTAASAVELVRRVDSPRCRMILDCNAAATEKASIPDLIRKHHKRMVHFHANDPNRQGPGFGDLDFVPIFQALKDVRFAGWVSVEVFDYTPGAERLARESIAYMKKCLKKIG